MKATDIQIGDWLRSRYQDIKGDEVVIHFRVSQIRKLEVTGSVYVWSDENGNMGDTDNNVEPIPITPEILEQSGFRHDSIRYGYHGPCDCFRIPLKSGFFIEGYKDGYYQITDHCLMRFQYVHELQNALRLCGIEKEITI